MAERVPTERESVVGGPGPSRQLAAMQRPL